MDKAKGRLIYRFCPEKRLWDVKGGRGGGGGGVVA